MKNDTQAKRTATLKAECARQGYPDLRGMRVEAATNKRVPGEVWDLEDFQSRKQLIRVARPGETWDVYVYSLAYRFGGANEYELEGAFRVEFQEGEDAETGPHLTPVSD